MVSKGGSETASLIAKINEEADTLRISTSGTADIGSASAETSAHTGRSTVAPGPVASEIHWTDVGEIPLPPAPAERGRSQNKLVNENKP